MIVGRAAAPGFKETAAGRIPDSGREKAPFGLALDEGRKTCWDIEVGGSRAGGNGKATHGAASRFVEGSAAGACELGGQGYPPSRSRSCMAPER